MTEPIVNPGEGCSPSTSASLLELARSNDKEAWERIFSLYSPLIYKWCRRRGLTEADTLDVGQEVFRSVSSGLVAFRKDGPGQSFRAWLRTITANKVADFLRLKNRQPGAVGGSDFHEFVENAPGGEDAAIEPDDDESERKVVLRRCLDAVRAEFEARTWDAFWAVAVDGLEAADVARSLGMSRNAVYLSKSRVLSRLARRFGEVVEGFGEM